MKKAISLLLALVLCLSLCACGVPTTVTQEQNLHGTSMFIEVEHATYWKVVYHRDTKVMYTISWAGEGAGVFTMLMNSDGTPQTWKGY